MKIKKAKIYKILQLPEAEKNPQGIYNEKERLKLLNQKIEVIEA